MVLIELQDNDVSLYFACVSESMARGFTRSVMFCYYQMKDLWGTLILEENVFICGTDRASR